MYSIKTVVFLGSSWREDFAVEHVGEYQDINSGCPQWNHQAMSVSVNSTSNSALFLIPTQQFCVTNSDWPNTDNKPLQASALSLIMIIIILFYLFRTLSPWVKNK